MAEVRQLQRGLEAPEAPRGNEVDENAEVRADVGSKAVRVESLDGVFPLLFCILVITTPPNAPIRVTSTLRSWASSARRSSKAEKRKIVRMREFDSVPAGKIGWPVAR